MGGKDWTRRDGGWGKRKATVEPSGYRDYIRSPEWQETRARYWASGMRKDCYACGRMDVPLDLHHWSYAHLGNEPLHDLVPLCRPCHEGVHRKHRENPGANLKTVTKEFRREKLYGVV